jgi:hypothetical protein
MNTSGNDNKERNREIARNEEARKTIGAVRVSIWALALAFVAAAIVWGWLRR